jgi:hypothetical protein
LGTFLVGWGTASLLVTDWVELYRLCGRNAALENSPRRRRPDG